MCGRRGGREVHEVCKQGSGLLLGEGVMKGYLEGRVREGQGDEAGFTPQTRYEFVLLVIEL
jgi:hypothetical protein